MPRLITTAIALAALLAASTPAVAAPASGLPAHVGDCVRTTIKRVETRLEDQGFPVPDSGSAVDFANGGYQVSYDTVAAIDQSRAGDPVLLCLQSIPKHCPAGDDRGRWYKTTNLRTHKSWALPDAEHGCGGA